MNKSTGQAFDGFASVVEMLKHSDARFREKILKNLSSLDPALANRILKATSQAISAEKNDYSRKILNQSIHQQQVKNYGARK